MARKILFDGDQLDGLAMQDPIRTTLSLETITPLFGGSAKAGYIDKTNPIRAASIRGHLRFWWRALFGTRYATTKDLFTAEEILWGSSEKPGLVSLKVLEAGRVEKEVEPSDFGGSKPARTGPLETYFLFPFAKSGNEPAKPGAQKVSFTIELAYHAPPDQLEDLQKQVESTLCAWITLGGIGARTRRGLGALRATSDEERWLPSNVDTLGSWLGLSEKANGGAATTEPDFPVLAGAKAVFGRNLSDIVRSGSGVEVLRAWRELAKFWARFRKNPLISNGGGHRPPNTGVTWPDHSKLLRLSRLGSSGSGELKQAKPFWGLPIVYQGLGKEAFKGTIEAAAPNGSRMASPVILKPVAFANGEIRPMVLVLKAPKPRRIKISGDGQANGEYALRFPSGNVKPLKSLGASTPEDAVINAAHKFGWNEEVVL